MSNKVPAILALADGTVFHGTSIGATGASVGEVVFNTAMTGYQEILTDPSYCQQIVTLTYPHIGNTGINPDDNECPIVHVSGLVIRDLPLQLSNWRSKESLSDFLVRHKVVAIADIDTRALTRRLRDTGAQNGCVMAGEDASAESALSRARAFAGLKGMDLAKVVSASRSYSWNEGSFDLARGRADVSTDAFHVVAYDFGVKQNILRMLADRGCRMTVVPTRTTAASVGTQPRWRVFIKRPRRSGAL